MQFYRETIENIYQLSIEMLRYSQQCEWVKVVEAEQKRNSLLGQLANIEIVAFDDASEKLLQKVIETNTEIERLSRQEMVNCRQEYHEVKNKKNAISAYSAF